jgi:hypothetical protein
MAGVAQSYVTDVTDMATAHYIGYPAPQVTLITLTQSQRTEFDQKNKFRSFVGGSYRRKWAACLNY